MQMSEYMQYIALSRYARWLPEGSRRETWEETVDRYFMFFSDRINLADSVDGRSGSQWMGELRTAVTNLEVMPSMRAMMTAGPALDRDNVAGFNCSYTPIGGPTDSIEVLTDDMKLAGFDEPVTVTLSSIHDFDELMYILLCGTGVGFSVERQYINHLPVVGHKLPRKIYARTDENFPGVDKNELSTFYRGDNSIRVADSKYGWASSLRILLTELYNGNFNIKWDLSKIRPAGQTLKTFGGRASGPGPLEELFSFVAEVFKHAAGRKLTSIECHDLVCKIAEVVVVGGVRRSALISLSNLTDTRMATAKSGNWWDNNPERRFANNSICFTEKPEVGSWLKEWSTIYESKSGERGVFSRPASQKQAAKNGRRDDAAEFGTNPCSEIILRPHQFCNLSEIVVRSTDTFADLERKTKYTTILGTLQATLTDFKYLRPIWKKNTEEEALLGVSLTGIMDHPILSGRNTHTWETDMRGSIIGFKFDGEERSHKLTAVLSKLKEVAIETNKVWAEYLGINQSAAITCVKPSGTVSQLVNSASGIHDRFAPYYIRTVRADKKDPVSKFMVKEGFPHEEDVTAPNSTYVFSFPVKAPESSGGKASRTAKEQLEHWLVYQRHWCEHKPSITVYVKDEEWPEVGAWVWEHFDEVSGVSFLPHTDHVYKQAPYTEITEEEYEAAVAVMPKDVDWTGIGEFEKEDMTIGMQELACTGGSCDIL